MIQISSLNRILLLRIFQKLIQNSFVCLKMALEILGWSQEETRFPLGGRILFTQPNEGNSISNWKKSWTTKLGPIHALLAVLSSEELPEVSPKKQLIFPSNISSIKDASLVIVRDKNAKNAPIRVSFHKVIIARKTK